MTRAAHRLAIAAAALVSLAPTVALADIKERRDGDGTLFVSRPDRKPGSDASSPSRASARVTVPRELEGVIEEVSRRYNMDPGLITTVISVESGFNHLAVSPKGARGLMQLMPATARDYGVRDVHDVRENVEGGVAYLRDLMRRYNGDLKLALAAYNAGPEAVERASGIPNYRETRDYLRRIEARYGQRLAGAGAASGAAIRATRDQDGTIVATNVGGKRVRIVRKPAVRPPSR